MGESWLWVSSFRVLRFGVGGFTAQGFTLCGLGFVMFRCVCIYIYIYMVVDLKPLVA